MNKHLLKYIIYLAGALCLYAFIAVRIMPFYNAILVEKKRPQHFEFTKYGELFYFSQISHFKENLPKPIQKFRLSEKQSNIEEADIVTFGDSFFDFSRVKTIPERLVDSLDKKVHAIYAFYPFKYFSRENYSGNTKKVFIYETVERMISTRFGHTQLSQEKYFEPGVSSFLYSVLDWIFPANAEERLNTMLKGTYLTKPFYSAISTYKFDNFGYISSKTPKYKLESKPWLFYYETVNNDPTGFYYQHSKEEVETYCDNIASMSHNLKAKYNFDFIFCAVPNKYSIYYTKADPAAVYNNLLPQIYKGLEKRGIKYVDLYNDFSQETDDLYFGTDSHWNEKGANIAFEKIIEQILK